MKGRKTGTRGMKVSSGTSVRASISFPPDLYETLEELARRKKVSLAWIVRDAAERYIADQQLPAAKQVDQ
jgi:metal-responsive CopG/Arc/MetJ family transcriptional regulator